MFGCDAGGAAAQTVGDSAGLLDTPRSVPQWQSLPAPHAALRAVVIVPAKDEAVLLPRCLAALARQRTARGTPVDARTFEVIVLANNCSDSTAAIARRHAAQQRDYDGSGCTIHVAEVVLPPALAHVGQARRLLMDEACARLRVAAACRGEDGRRGVVLSTDGDSMVATDWLAATLAEIDAGAEAVGGRILCEAEPPHDARPAGRALQRWQRLDAIYRLLRIRLECLIDPDPADPWPRHHQHFGASLAVTVEAYERVGGLPALRFLEDEALFGLLTRAGLRVRHSPQVRVYTSCRQEGRVEVGLSWQLREWAHCCAAGSAEMRVEAASGIVVLVQARARLRNLWNARTLATAAAPRGGAAVARALSVPPGWLRPALHGAPTFGSLWGEIEAYRAAHLPPGAAAAQMPVREAIEELKRLVGSHCGSARTVPPRASKAKASRPPVATLSAPSTQR